MNHDDFSSHGDLPVPRTGATGPTGTPGTRGTSGTTPGSTGTSGNGTGSTTNARAAADSINANDLDDIGSNLKDRARDFASTAQDKLADVGGAVRDGASHLKDSLADALDSGADKLRQRGTQGTTQYASAAAGSTTIGMEDDGRMSGAARKVAGGMEASADWLRTADLDGVRDGIESQVKRHPGLTLLVAAGLGYLLGKAFRD